MPLPEDGRSPVARGVFWASQITTIGFMFTVPAIGGYIADQKLGTKPWLLITGTIIGFLVGMLELVKLAQRANQTASRQRPQFKVHTSPPVLPLTDRIDTTNMIKTSQKDSRGTDQPTAADHPAPR